MIDLLPALSGLCLLHGVPSASLVVRRRGRVLFRGTTGLARREPERLAAPDQAYDLASLTKPLVGAAVTAALLEHGALDLDEPVCGVLPGVPAGVTFAHLLSHDSGLPAWAPLYREVQGAFGTQSARRTVLDAARRLPLEAAPGTRHRYSDIGFLLLLDALETRGGAPIDALWERYVRAPSGVADLRFGWPGAAATEACPVRGFVVEGTVHDLNAAALGGVSTHAGLFGTADAVAALTEALAIAAGGADNGLPGAGLAAMWNRVGAGTHRGGWDTRSPGVSSTGRHFPPDTRGHLGYTGTSTWTSPARGVTVTLLTNRVHPTDDLTGIKALRPAVHDLVAEALGWNR